MWTLSEYCNSGKEVNNNGLSRKKYDEPSSLFGGTEQLVEQDHEGESTAC